MSREDGGIKTYKRRWWMIFLFIAFCTANAAQWSEYTVIEDVIVDFYQVNSSYVEWTAMCYAFVLTFFIVPCVWLLEKYGLKKILLWSAWLNAAGAAMKIFSTEKDAFIIAFIGNWIVAVGQLGYLPGRVAAVWFGADEVSTACSLGVLGNQIGVSLGFVIPPMLVQKHDDPDITKSQLKTLNYVIAGACLVTAVLMQLTIEERPKLPPSQAAKEQRKEKIDFGGTMKRLAANKGYLILMCINSIDMGVFSAVATLLNRIVLSHFPDAATDVGWMGLAIVLMGGLGTVLTGILLDKIGHYKEVAIGIFVSATISALSLAFVIDKGQIVFVYIASTSMGFFLTAYFTVSFELAAELTYPENEGTSSGIMNGVPQSMAIVATMLGSWLIKSFGVISCLYFFAFSLSVGALLTTFIPRDYRRSAMRKADPSKENDYAPEIQPLRQTVQEKV